MKNNSNNTLTFREITTIFGAFFFIGLYFYMTNLGDKLRKNHRYTIATIYKTHWSLKSGKFADSKYKVNGVEYTCSADADALAGEHLVGRKFLLKFHPPHPDLSILYLNAPIWDPVPSVPADGWVDPPVAVPKHALR
ncbi:hypothetical protein [Hymenobacter lapidiphilus]|uniref:hypothetical protein n=1 Tax=Hymenobacter sp. CCM 8763 TaxID=2303334 RepID=UPI0011C1512C|nr:hypothetical protein [Hymenobacter sp. CCM 8763]